MGLNMHFSLRIELALLGGRVLQNYVNPSNTTTIVLRMYLNFVKQLSKTKQTRQDKYILSLISIALYDTIQITLQRNFRSFLHLFHSHHSCFWLECTKIYTFSKKNCIHVRGQYFFFSSKFLGPPGETDQNQVV